MRHSPAQALVRQAIAEIFNEGRLDAADTLFAPGYVNHGGVIPDLVAGPEAVKVSAALYRRAFPALHITVLTTRTDGEMVIVRWLARDTKPDCRATARPVAPGAGLAGVTRIRVTAGRIAESWTDWNHDDVLRRLGLIESDADARDEPATSR
jgi:predicted SnoaL-like aldol condensation-catalyzing enzyme